MYYPEIQVSTFCFFSWCLLFFFCFSFLLSKADWAWWIKISLRPSLAHLLLHEEHNVTRQYVIKLSNYTSKNRCFLTDYLCVEFEMRSWGWKLSAGCLFFCFSPVRTLEMNLFPFKKKTLNFFHRWVQRSKVFLFPLLWPLCPCPCLNVQSSLFLDSLLQNTELIKGLLSTS